MPRIHDLWLSELLSAELPAEKRSTCDNCAMCGNQTRSTVSFQSDTKCCTFWPSLANFLVGGALLDETESGRDGRSRVLQFARRGWATPLMLLPAPAHRMLYAQTKSREFGRSPLLKCPYLGDGGGCTIWKQRNAICATWFCKYERGVASQQFWDAVRRFLTGMERSVAIWCCLELGISGESVRKALEMLHKEDLERLHLDGSPRSHSDVDLWGTWNDQRVEFYERCARAASDLSWADACQLGGAECRSLADAVKETFGNLRRPIDLSRKLMVSHLRVLSHQSGEVVLSGHIETDPVVVSERVLNVLHLVDGKTGHEAELVLRRAGETQLGHELIDALVQAQILRLSNTVS